MSKRAESEESTQGTLMKKRKRTGPSHRWTTEEEIQILDYLKDTVLKSEDIEKPTSKAYYEKLIKERQLKNVNEVKVKAKVTNLKSLYTKAVEWRNKTGQGVLETDGEESVRSYILKICPLWDLLDEIFGSKTSINPPFIHSTDGDYFGAGFEPLTPSHDINQMDDVVDNFDHGVTIEFDNQASNTTSSRSQTIEGPEVVKVNKYTDQLAKEPKTWKKAGGQKDSLAILTDIQKQRSDSMTLKNLIERDRLDAEQKWREDQMQLEKMKLESLDTHRKAELELKEKEMEKEERLKIMQLEKEERLEKFKIEQEIKLQLDLAKLKSSN